MGTSEIYHGREREAMNLWRFSRFGDLWNQGPISVFNSGGFRVFGSNPEELAFQTIGFNMKNQKTRIGASSIEAQIFTPRPVEPDQRF